MSDYLPEEILIAILVKLPAKSLIRATSVCKPWRCLIRSPSFISAHLSNSTENQALFRRYSYRDDREHYTVFPKGGPFGICKSSPELEFPFQCSIGCYFRIVGSCDGLVCLYDSHRIIIWNPAIRSHVVLPQPLVHPCRELHRADELEFGAQNEYQRTVLGFGVASNVYKVVRLASCEKPKHYCFIAEVFSIGTGMWRKLSGFPVWVRPDISSIFFKGFVHWIASEITDCTSILTFHVGDEVSSQIMLPKELGRHSELRLKLAMRGESLGLFNWSRERGTLIWDVWMMKDYGVEESWTKLYRIDSLRFEKAIGFWGSGEVLLGFNDFELVTYNVETKEIEHVWNCCMRGSLYINDYKESLILLGGGYSGGSEEELSRGAFEGLIQGVEKLVVE